MEDGWLLGDETSVNSGGRYSLWNSPVSLRDLCGSAVEFFPTEVTEDHRGKRQLTLTSLCGGMNPREEPGDGATARLRLSTDRRQLKPAPAPRAGCTARTPGSGAAFLPCVRAFEE